MQNEQVAQELVKLAKELVGITKQREVSDHEMESFISEIAESFERGRRGLSAANLINWMRKFRIPSNADNFQRMMDAAKRLELRAKQEQKRNNYRILRDYGGSEDKFFEIWERAIGSGQDAFEREDPEAFHKVKKDYLQYDRTPYDEVYHVIAMAALENLEKWENGHQN